MELRGTVIRGDGYGKTLSFPTANIDRTDYQYQNLHLTYGIYAGFVSRQIWDEPKLAGIVIGPDDAEGLPKLEAHIFDFDEDLYGEEITFHLAQFIRPYMKYKDEQELKRNIALDIATIKNLKLCLPE